MIKSFFCKWHRAWFTNVCVGCIDDIFHHGFGVPRKTSVETLDANYDWDSTWEFIQNLPFTVK